MKKELSSETYQEKKLAIIGNEPVVKPVPMSAIKLESNSLRDGFVIIDGNVCPVEQSFFTDLVRVLDINAKLGNKLRGADKDGADGFFSAMVEALKMYHTRSRDNTVTIAGDQNSKSITSLYKGKYARMSNEMLFEQAERLIDQHGLLVTDVVGDGGPKGGFTIKMLSPASQDMTRKIGSGEVEEFNFGFLMRNAGGGTSIGDFGYRLVCSNGMMGMSEGPTYTLPGSSGPDLIKLNDKINEYADRGFSPLNFDINASNASSTKASLREVENAFRVVENQVDAPDPDVKSRIITGVRDSWFPGLTNARQRLYAQKHEPNDLTKDQKRFVKTNMSIWDVINSLTFLASNDTGVDFKNKETMMREAGKVFTRTHDLTGAQFMSV